MYSINHWLTVQNRRARLELNGRHLKELAQFRIKILLTNETKNNLYKNDGNNMLEAEHWHVLLLVEHGHWH